ncbi:hypothetical protein DFH06DRAFT_1367832, partial [Mycena polygramma]
DQGNAFCPGPDARQPWVPYHGPLPQLTQGPVAQAPQFTQPPPPFLDSNRGAPNSPIEHAFAEQYQFALRPVQSGFAPQPIPIDPALLRLPRDGPDLRKAKPAGKVGGSRHKDKGKKRQRDSSASGRDSEPAAKRGPGRPQGSANYSKEDISNLFDFVGVELPVGQKGWKEVHRRYRKYAAQNHRPERAPKALESKYKQYLKQKKPTGDAACPPEVKRAHELENLINERVSTRDLSDSEFDDDSDAGSSDDKVEVVDRPRQCTAVARRNPTPPLRCKSRPSGADLANQLANAFDPAAQQGRDDARSARCENTQMLTVAQQLRDLQGVTESLRSQNSVLQNHIHDLERARDRSELKLELLQMTKGDDRERGRSRRPSHHSRRPSPPPPRLHRSHKHTPGIDRVNGKIRCEQQYPDGGAMTYFLSDPSSGDEDDKNANP